MFTIAPKKIKIVPDAKGRPSGVLIDMQTWEAIIEALEMAEDLSVIRKALSDLRAADGNLIKAGFIPWSDAKAKLEKRDAKKQAL